jgi:shikimate kinase
VEQQQDAVEMDLIVIHGPPATGKFSVGHELARLTGYKLFHNHLTVDLVHSLFEIGEGPFWKLNGDIRLKLLEAAAKNKVKGVIMTFCYVKGEDEKLLARFMRKLEKYNVRFLFVHLYCERETLLKRVKNPSRKTYKKISTRKLLISLLKKKDYYTPFAHRSTISIDNTSTSVKKVAKTVVQRFKLKGAS